MLNNVAIENLGSNHRLEIEFGSKLTLLTGDADMHQRLLLESAWVLMSTSWPVRDQVGSGRAVPAEPENRARIEALVKDARGETGLLGMRWRPEDNLWARESDGAATMLDADGEARPRHARQTALYADSNGDFHVWMGSHKEYGTSYHTVTREEVWTGQRFGHPQSRWRGAVNRASGDEDQAIAALVPRRYRERYTNPERPSTEIADEAPEGGVGRMAALAFLGTWAAWRTSDEARYDAMTVFIEEPELHLHPSWQRELMTRLATLEELLDGMPLQVVVITNSPLIAASAEPLFRPETTRHWDISIDRNTGAPKAEQMPLLRRGTADTWLMSDVFGLKTARNTTAEAAIEDAKRVQLSEAPSLAEANAIDRRLRTCLGDDDRFWVRWTYWIEELRSGRIAL